MDGRNPYQTNQAWMAGQLCPGEPNVIEGIRRVVVKRGLAGDACFRVPEFRGGARGLSLPLTIVCDTSSSLGPYEQALCGGFRRILEELYRGERQLRAVDLSVLCFDSTVRLLRDFGEEPAAAPPAVAANRTRGGSCLFTALFVAWYRGELRKRQLQEYQRQDGAFRYFQPTILLISDYGGNDPVRLAAAGQAGGDLRWSGRLDGLVLALLEAKVNQNRLGLLSAPFGRFDTEQNGGNRQNLCGGGMYEIRTEGIGESLQELIQSLHDTLSNLGAGELAEAGQEEGALSPELLVESMQGKKARA